MAPVAERRARVEPAPAPRGGDGVAPGTVSDAGRPADDPDDLAPAFLIGAARSGTSLLYKALCLHPETAWISNWVKRVPAAPRLAALNRLAGRFPAARRRVWFGEDSNAYVYGAPRALAERLFPMPVEGEPVYRRSGVPLLPGDPAAAPEDQTARLRGAFAAIRGASGGRRLVSKRIGNNLRIPLLARVFPRARFVEIVRDGRAVALSLSRVDWWMNDVVWWYGGTPARWAAEGRDPWEICARNWVEELREIGRGLQTVSPEQVLRIRYETFVERPHETLERVRDFLGLSSDEGWRRELGRLRYPDRNEAWRERLAPDVAARITAWQADELRRLGYLDAASSGRAAGPGDVGAPGGGP
jgi:hypothetical protein